MSTKIFTGFAWACPDIAEVMMALRELEGHIRDVCNARKASALGELATRAVDQACMAMSRKQMESEKSVEPDQSPLTEAWQKMWDRQARIRQSMQRDPAVDFEVRIVMWYVPELAKFVGHVLSEDGGEAYRILLESEGVSDFSYWDNTDAPEHLWPEEWTARGALWDRISNDEFGLPLVITIDADIQLSNEVVGQHLLSHETRVKRVAINSAFNLWAKETDVVLQETGAEGPDVDRSISAWLDFMDEKDNPESAASRLITSEKVRVAALLPVDIGPLLARFSEEKAKALLKAG